MQDKNFLGSYIKLMKQQAFYKDYWHTFEVVPARSDRLKRAVFNLRYNLYCEHNKFLDKDDYPDKMEIDMFDEEATHFALIYKRTGKVVGTIRVLVPDPMRPLTSFETQKYCDHPMLQIENRVMGTCEISRFCMDPYFLRREEDGNLLPAYHEQEWNNEGNKRSAMPFLRRRIPYAPLGLFMAAFEVALDHDLTNCITFIEPDHLESLDRLGFDFRVLGPRINVHGEQQPLVFNIKSTLDSMAIHNRECWEVISDHGRLHQLSTQLFQYDWQDSVFDEATRERILNKLL